MASEKTTKEHTSKNSRRLKKQILRLKDRDGISVSEQPTRTVCVCNGGLACGVSSQQIVALFNKYDSSSNNCDDFRIEMFLNKSYAFVHFTKAEKSQEAVTSLTSDDVTLAKTQPAGPICLLYVADSHCVLNGVAPAVRPGLPPGLVLVDEYIDKDYEQCLLSAIEWGSGQTDQDSGGQTDLDTSQNMKHRRVKHYGFAFRYDNNNIDKDCPLADRLPDHCQHILRLIQADGFCDGETADQLTVNQYEPGQGIPAHIDTHSAFTDWIISLSLGSQTVMEFRSGAGDHVPVVVRPRSLLVMKGESRFSWTHGITPRKTDTIRTGSGGDYRVVERTTRTSYTFRKIRHTPCQCDFSVHCDSQSGGT